MALKPENAQLVYLLLGVLEFFGSDLPVSKQAAESDAKLQWPQHADFKEEIERIRNYFDDFCVEMGLIELGMKSYYATNASGSSVELSSTAERMLKFLESLLNREFAPSVDRSEERFLKVRRLHQLVASANKLGRTFADIDGLCHGGSVRFSIDQREAKRALEVLQRCRSVICDSFHDTLGPTLSNEDDDNPAEYIRHVDQERSWNREARWLSRDIRVFSSLVDRSAAECSVIRSTPAPFAMICLFREPTSPNINTVAFWKHWNNGEYNWVLSNVLISDQAPKAAVSVTLTEITRVRFSNEANEPAHSADPPPRLDTICQIIQHIQEGGCITGANGADCVVFDSGEHTFTLTNIAARESTSFISLRTLLQRQRLSLSEKNLLAATLSEFILQLDGLWHGSRCVSMSDSFYLPLVEDTPGQTNVNITQPFLAIYPGEEQGDREANLRHFFHSHPFVLDLGVLLIELQYNTTIESLRKASDPETIYTNYATAWELIESQEFEEKATKSHQSAIKACLRCDFLPHDARPATKQFQRLVYEHILRPLKLQEYLDVIDEHVEEPHSHPEDVRSTDTAPSQTAEPKIEPLQTQWKKLGVVLEDRLQVFDEPDDRVRPTAPAYADEWMRRLGIFHEQVMDPLIDAIESSEAAESLEDERIKRTKVAVIDTGICWEDPFIAGARDRIKETCNWVPDKTGLVNTFDVEDRFGHGTQTALLLLKVAPGVEVCIARVSEDGLLDNASYVAEAITWAVQNCQADIITMSFGFEERSDIVLDAVLAAYKERKILFAAASNGGGNDDIAFPANQREVIGVFSTDGGGNASLFNPTFPDMDDGSYFSTLGEAVELYSLPVRDAKGTPVFNKARKSGTSFATPIAAGIAANILDYAKAKRNIGEESLRQLHNFSGMIAVLKLLAPGKRNDHNYLCPWKLWKDRSAKARERDADLIRTQILIELKA